MPGATSSLQLSHVPLQTLLQQTCSAPQTRPPHWAFDVHGSPGLLLVRHSPVEVSQ